MFKNFKNWKNEVDVEDLHKIGRTEEEFDELIETIVNYCESKGTIKYITPSLSESPRIFVYVDTEFNLRALAVNLSARTGLKYRINKKLGTITLLL